MNTTTVNEILAISRLRGIIRATHDRADGIYNPAPLSGEWAGESINEILGDLIGLVEDEYDDDADWMVGEMCHEYEDGYDSVFDIDDSSRAIRDAVFEGML